MSSTLVKTKIATIPTSLIYEMDEGKPIYYRGYKEVLNKTKTTEQIMGSSALQSLLIMLISDFLKENLAKNYIRLTSELGFQFKKKSWRSLDIAIYDLNKVADKNIFFKNKYIRIPPLITIEIDTKADLSELPDPTSYYTKKTDQLLNNGVSKIIWIFTATRKVMVAEEGSTWTIDNWSEDIDIINEVVMNIEQLIDAF